MSISRGEVVLLPFPFASGGAAKRRPALVIQSDHNNTRLANVIVAQITSNTSRAGQERTQVLIDVATPEGSQSGLHFDSAVTCENLATVEQSLVVRKLGTLPTTLMDRVNDAFKASLGIP